MSQRIPLTLATGDYDHVRDLGDGTVVPEGVELTWLRLPPEEIFSRFARRREWEVSEFSLGLYTNMVSRGDRSVTGIPVFPSRAFRHGAFYTRPDGPRSLEELAGLTVGVPEWAQTACIWARGLLAEQFGVDLKSIRWVQGGLNEPGRTEKATIAAIPFEIRVEREHSLDDLLRKGQIDALISARPPAGSLAGELRPVLADPRSAERLYWQTTGVFPIMHVVVIRSDVLERWPWVAHSLFEAFDTARRRSVERLLDPTASHVPLPWVSSLAQEAQAGFGGEVWPYGVARNLATLSTFIAYAADHGVIERSLDLAELFPLADERVVV